MFDLTVPGSDKPNVRHAEFGSSGPDAPVLAILIPVFKHSVLLAEAIESALAQVAPFKIAVVIVDDGCPFPETAHVGQAYALAHENVFYLRKANGGLSSARNYGIEFALRSFAGLEAIYFLDADNRITPPAMRVLMNFLRSSAGVDWVYPNIDKFGIEWNGNYTAQYSRLLHVTFDNICEAGSLVSRSILDAGVRFDESMKSGFEDWDFWLQAISKGFKGANHPFFGFEYRQRAESMLRDSNRSRESILAYIKTKHKKLFSPDTLLKWEHEEAPRFAAIGTDSYLVDLFTDPVARPENRSLEEFVRRFWAARSEPETFGVPPFWLWMSPPHREALRSFGLLHNVLWLGERLSQSSHFVAIRFESDKDRIAVEVVERGAGKPLAKRPLGWMCSLGIVQQCVADKSDDWVRSLQGDNPAPKVAEIVIRGPFSADDIQGTALSSTNSLLATLGALRDSGYKHDPDERWIWRSAYLPDRSRYFELLRQTAGAGPLMPRLAKEGGALRIGLLLPIASFGGVEKVAYAMARVLKQAGCEVHLFVFGKPVYSRIPDNEGVFDSLNFLAADYPLWGGPQTFSGHEILMAEDENARLEEVLGLLTGLDVVVNNQLAPANAVFGELRRRGVKVVNYIHVLDSSEMGRPAGHPYLALAYEHIYDSVLTCSRDMAEWLHAMGVPMAKLLHIPNAAGYPMAPDEVKRLADGRQRDRDGPLRALFLGRLDRQKGIERIFAAARALKRRGVEIDWRIVGADVLDEGAGGSWKERFGDIGIKVEPPVHDSRRLSKLMAWADVFVLPSRWEGAPLTIVEAQRLGCVPVVTDVGAVKELIEDGVDGLLLRSNDDGVVTYDLIAVLESLAQPGTVLRELSAKAASRASERSWEKNLQPFLRQLHKWFPDQLQSIRRGKVARSGGGDAVQKSPAEKRDAGTRGRHEPWVRHIKAHRS
ncbi:glycosyltransferase [Roseibium aggregatum]|uniref:Glycosyltransferase n=1 Tax=Roseibium aggregatum TaxID=187304 RepID=A0A939J5Z5_9HYPH|nr:glycosyltransferase [Roseibium aggregatum]MBN9672254.1 glycosyltransferase [Roseibium aggregatum]